MLALFGGVFADSAFQALIGWIHLRKEHMEPVQNSRRDSRFASFPILAMAIALGWPLAKTTVAQNVENQHMSHRELKHLIQTATTREDHLRIVAYYRAEASKLHKDAAEHADLEKSYANAMSSPKQYPSAYDHCKSFAWSMEQSAKQADALASMHQEIADQVKQ